MNKQAKPYQTAPRSVLQKGAIKISPVPATQPAAGFVFITTLFYVKEQHISMRSINPYATALALLLMLSSMTVQGRAQELTIDKAITMAMEQSPDIQALHKAYVAEKGRAWTTWWPSDPNLVYGWEGVPRGAGLEQFDEKRLTLTQQIEFPTNILWRNRLASREVEAARWRLEQGKLNVRAAVIEAYYRYLASNETLQLARERVALAEDFYNKVSIRRRVGEAPAIEMVRANVELTRSRNDLRGAESRARAAMSRLNSILGRKADSPITSADSLHYRRLDGAITLDNIREQALAAHPVLREAGALVSAAGHMRKLAWGSLLPAIEISAFRQNLGGNPDFYGIEVGLQVPLWFAFRQRGEIQQSVARYSMQKSIKLRQQLDLLSDIEASFSEYQAQRDQVEAYIATLLEQANEVYRIALRSYEEGEIGYLQVIEAQQTLIEVRQGYIDTLAGYYAAIAALERASGLILLQ